MLDDVLKALRDRYGKRWSDDDEANLRFSADAEFLMRGVDGVHLIGDPEIDGDHVTLTVWVDFPLRDVMAADRLAYEIFGRLSEDMFYTERHFESRTVRYPFVTGSASHGHIGVLVLAGPHAAEFAERLSRRLGTTARFHA